MNSRNIFIFGIKPKSVSDQYGYFISKKINNLNQVSSFIEKPNLVKAKSIIKKGGYWNSGMFFLRKDSLIYNFKYYQKKIYNYSLLSVKKSKYKNNIYYLNKKKLLLKIHQSHLITLF